MKCVLSIPEVPSGERLPGRTNGNATNPHLMKVEYDADSREVAEKTAREVLRGVCLVRYSCSCSGTLLLPEIGEVAVAVDVDLSAAAKELNLVSIGYYV